MHPFPFEELQKILELKDTELEIDELLETLGLFKHRYKLPNQLSGGQQQRVSIGRAIVKNPDILLCDEPTGALDRKNADEVLNLLLKTREEFGTTLVMVTHDLSIAERADRIFRMNAGEISLERDYLPGYKPLEVNRTIRR